MACKLFLVISKLRRVPAKELSAELLWCPQRQLRNNMTWLLWCKQLSSLMQLMELLRFLRGHFFRVHSSNVHLHVGSDDSRSDGQGRDILLLRPQRHSQMIHRRLAGSVCAPGSVGTRGSARGGHNDATVSVAEGGDGGLDEGDTAEEVDVECFPPVLCLCIFETGNRV